MRVKAEVSYSTSNPITAIPGLFETTTGTSIVSPCEASVSLTESVPVRAETDPLTVTVPSALLKITSSSL